MKLYKSKALLFGMLFLASFAVMAQNESDSESSSSSKGSRFIYVPPLFTLVPDGSYLPMIGLINVAQGDHLGVQMGLVSMTEGNFKGIGMGLANIVGGDVLGVQMGLVNAAGGNHTGIQMGLVNTTGGNHTGIQMGLVNYADSLSGASIALVSIIRKGGFYSLGVGVSPMSPASIILRGGMEYFYTILSAGWSYEDEFISGFGFGTTLELTPKVRLRPELVFFSATDKIGGLDFTLGLHYQVAEKFNIWGGPSLAWYRDLNGGAKVDPYLERWDRLTLPDSIDKDNRMAYGFRFGVDYEF